MQFRSAHLLLSKESKHGIVKGDVGIEPEKFEKAIPVISCPYAHFGDKYAVPRQNWLMVHTPNGPAEAHRYMR